MARAFVCAARSVQPTMRHTDYIANWLQVLEDDKRTIFKAASLTSKTADHIPAFDTQGPETLVAAPTA